jgi:hypothetical protein
LINGYSGDETVEVESADTNIVKILGDNIVPISSDGEIEIKVQAVGDVDLQTQIRVKLSSKSDWQDVTDIKVGPPLILVYLKPLKTETYVGDMLPVVVMLTNDGGATNVDTTFDINITDFNNLDVYWDENGTQKLDLNTTYSINGIDTLYVTSSSVLLNQQFTVESPEGYRVVWDGSLTFTEPPIVRIFFAFEGPLII